ncbi:hypothetical protein [uncultured Pseudodesulfovibrio sp.]|uniref:hypothetical protein n=1 Tax=uncultured Pseudodesulfovibrio sp. TaxID=2035858 RepID=UPI0029C61CF9|nr:hypothetical protein [uncultured Pseudodesulfovibrio sp.]
MNTVRSIAKSDSRFYAKSEFGPVSDDWPVLSFTHRTTAQKFAKNYRRERDFVIYVGTSSSKNTPEPNHRQNLLCLVSVEKHEIRTEQVLSKKAWSNVVKEYGVRWEWSLPVFKAYELVNYPSAKEIMPASYSMLGQMKYRGRCVKLSTEEIDKLLDSKIKPIELELTDRVRGLSALTIGNEDLKKEINRLVNLILNSAARSGKERGGQHPPRKSLSQADLYILLNKTWNLQNGRCALCGGAIPIKTSNPLLQISSDRIDSECKAYDEGNIQLT